MYDDHVPLGVQFPSMTSLPALLTPDLVGGPLFHRLEASGGATWANLAQWTPAEVQSIKHMGPLRTQRLVGELARLAGRAQATTTADPAAAGIGDALATISAWAVATGAGADLLSAIVAAASTQRPDRPTEAIDALAAVPTDRLATPEGVALFDPVIAAERFIESLDERDAATFERVIDIDDSSPTLEKVGEAFGVTRERIRQVEVRLKGRLDRLRIEPAGRALQGAALRLRDRLGVAVPLASIRDEFATFPPYQIDRLLLHLAGPYHLRGEWFLLDELGDIARAVVSVFDEAAADGWLPLDALLDGLAQIGVRDEFRMAAIDSCPAIRVLDDAVIDWRGSVGDKAIRLLGWRGTPMLIDELHAVIGEGRGNLSNQLGRAEGTVVRVGVKRYALASWDVAGYRGIANEMAAAITKSGEPIDIDVLAQQLHDEFGAALNSVKIMSGTHPAFITEDGRVSLRPTDQPYQPKDSLEATARCYLVDGAWAWRIPVDRDVVRGSGRTLPEAFAVHLGLDPLAKTTIDSPIGPIRLGWSQNAAIGSLRRAAESVSATLGDQLLVIRQTPSLLVFRRIPADASTATPGARLRALIGDASDRPLLRVLADAIGLTTDRAPSAEAVIAALRARGDGDLADLAEETLAD